MVVEHKVEGYDEFIKFMKTLENEKKPIYIYFSGSKIDGVSWCDDCIRAEPIVREQLKKADSEAIFVFVEVGDRKTYKDPKCSFRKDQKLQVLQIPTLMRWGGPQKLIGEQCEKSDLVEMLFTDED